MCSRSDENKSNIISTVCLLQLLFFTFAVVRCHFGRQLIFLLLGGHATSTVTSEPTVKHRTRSRRRHFHGFSEINARRCVCGVYHWHFTSLTTLGLLGFTTSCARFTADVQACVYVRVTSYVAFKAVGKIKTTLWQDLFFFSKLYVSSVSCFVQVLFPQINKIFLRHYICFILIRSIYLRVF